MFTYFQISAIVAGVCPHAEVALVRGFLDQAIAAVDYAEIDFFIFSSMPRICQSGALENLMQYGAAVDAGHLTLQTFLELIPFAFLRLAAKVNQIAADLESYQLARGSISPLPEPDNKLMMLEEGLNMREATLQRWWGTLNRVLSGLALDDAHGRPKLVTVLSAGKRATMVKELVKAAYIQVQAGDELDPSGDELEMTRTCCFLALFLQSRNGSATFEFLQCTYMLIFLNGIYPLQKPTLYFVSLTRRE